MENTIRGVYLGALMPVGIAFASTIVWSLLQPGATLSFIVVASVFAAIMSAIVSAISTLLFGVPTYLLFERLRIRSARAYLIWGIIFSIILGILFVYPTGPQNAAQQSGSILVLLVALLSGPAASIVFWKTARPDLPATEKT